LFGNKKIVHVCVVDKFIPPFIDFVEQHFTMADHEFRVFGDMQKYPIKSRENIKVAGRDKLKQIKAYLQLIFAMHKAKKIILHGLFNTRVTQILWAMPWLLKKCYWVMWGGDLYVYSLDKRDKAWSRGEFFRRPVIKKMGHFVGYIKGEYELAKKWYGVDGEYHRCFMYTSNLCKSVQVELEADSGISILVGNSADSSNNHIEVFDKLEGYEDQDISIYVPLSYGNSSYAQQMILEGKKRFGDKFIPLTKFIPFEDYLKLLSKIDIAIFNHNRQQGMGNIRTLLGLGKKVYMRPNLTSSESLKEDGIKVFLLNNFNLEKSFLEKNENIRLMKKIYSQDKLIQDMKEIF